MSTAGSGNVVAATGAGAGIVVGGLLVTGVGAIVGAGILIGRGMMWCGEKLEENYQNACQDWTNVTEAARAENLANVQEASSYFAVQLDRMAASAYLAVNSASATTAQPARAVEQKGILDAIARTRLALADAHTVAQSKTDTEQDLLRARLQAEIDAGRDILPGEQITKAEAALQASPDVMRNALTMLEAAWTDVTEAQARRTRNIRQTQQALLMVTTQLSAVEALLHETKSAHNLAYVEQQRAIEQQVREARAFLDVNAASALALANEAQQAVRRLVESVSADAQTSWNSARKEINTQRGVLEALSKMMQEATAIKLIDPQKAESLTERITKAQAEAQTLAQGNVSNVSQRLARLTERVELLKDDVFTQVKTNQQRSVAQTVASTLAELGFQSSAGSSPTLKTNGDVMRVEAMISKGTPGGPRDEKVVSFDISRDGVVNYDFSGYIGDSCVEEAKRVFDALRAKGVYILDDQATEDLQRIPTASITTETLSQARFHPRVTKNKTQAELAESLKRVLEQMQYPNVRQSAIGGAIELEAFKGQVGYRVVLPSDGSAQVLKDANHTDVSNNPRDPIAAEARRTIQQEAQMVAKVKPKSARTKPPKRQVVSN